MSADGDEEIRKCRESIAESKDALLASGFTAEQVEHLGKFVLASIGLIQYEIVKAGEDIKSESAFRPGEFQTKVL